MSFLSNQYVVKTKGFKFLDDLSKHFKKPVVTELFFSFEDAPPELVSMIEDFFKESSLKKSLKKHFKISSPSVCSFIDKEMIEVRPKCISLNLNFLLSIWVLYSVFLDKEKPNHDGFLNCLKNHQILSKITPLYKNRDQLKGLLSHFTEDQKIEILAKSGLYDEYSDTLSMFFLRDDFFLNVLKGYSFEKVNTFQKLHNVFATHVKKIKEEDFVLLQERHNPSLNNLSLINKEHSFAVPRTHHELVLWGSELGHCIGSRHYAEKAFAGNSILLGVKKADKIRFTLEIISKRIVQIQGVSMSRPDAKLLSSIEKKLEEQGLILKKK